MRFEKRSGENSPTSKLLCTISENGEDLFEAIKSGGGHDSGGEDSALNVFELSLDKSVTKV